MTASKERKIALILFLIYMAVVLRLTVFRSGFLNERLFNLTLFIDLIDVYRNAGVRLFLWLFIGNIIWFVPFGFLMPILLKKESFLKIAGLGFMFSFAIESVQFIFRLGVAELDDLILNTFGAVIGYLIYRLIAKKYFLTKK